MRVITRHRWRKFVAFGDLHGDQQDEASVAVLLRFMESFKPDLRVCLGDVFDLRPLRRNAPAEERAESLSSDLAVGRKFLEDTRPEHWVLGNHEHRLWEMAGGGGVLGDYARRGVEDMEALARGIGCRITPYSVFSPLRVDNLTFVHGFRANRHACKFEAAAFGAPGWPVFFGHTHAISRDVGENGATGVNTGCLCRLDLGYNSRREASLRWENGFVAGVWSDIGWEAWFCRSFGGEWPVPSCVSVLHGEVSS